MAPLTQHITLTSLLVGAVLATLLAVPAQCELFSVPFYKYPTNQPLPVTATSKYDPTTKDWAAVVSACLAAGRKEKRYFNFFTRAAFHDSMAVPAVSCTTCPQGGADASLLLTMAELMRPENTNDLFALTAARVVKRIAGFYGTSVADTLAVCGLVSTAGLTNGEFDIFRYAKLRVGRIDNLSPNPEGQLPSPFLSRQEFYDFWTQRNFTIDEGIALVQGSHALVDEQKCFRGRNGDPNDYCDPFYEDCSDVKMFQFDNHMFIDGCTPMPPTPSDNPTPTLPVDQLNATQYTNLQKIELCKFTSYQHKSKALQSLQMERQGKTTSPRNPSDEVNWPNNMDECQAAEYPMNTNCPHVAQWGYTVMDARMGQACQDPSPTSYVDKEIKRCMLKFAQNKAVFQEGYAKAYVHMMTAFVNWAPVAPFYITGQECLKGWKSTTRGMSDRSCTAACKYADKNCPDTCVCSTSFYKGTARRGGLDGYLKELLG